MVLSIIPIFHAAFADCTTLVVEWNEAGEIVVDQHLVEVTRCDSQLLVGCVRNPKQLVERDVDPVDNNDRLLRYVWYVSGIDGQLHFLNVDLVEEGFALAKTYEPNTKYQDELDAAENRAISEGRGMWTTCDASVSLDPALEQDGQPDSEPIDRSQEPASVGDEDAACSFFATQSEAQDFLDEFPEIAPDLDPDGNGVACDGYYR